MYFNIPMGVLILSISFSGTTFSGNEIENNYSSYLSENYHRLYDFEPKKLWRYSTRNKRSAPSITACAA